VIPAGVRVSSPTLRCRRRRSHSRQPYIRDSSGSSSNVAEMTSWQTTESSATASYPLFRRVFASRHGYYVQPGHPPQRYIPYSNSCFCDLQEITSLQKTVARSYSKCVALSVMRTIRRDVNGIHVSTIRNLIRQEGSG
jgi:hypothetical protein